MPQHSQEDFIIPTLKLLRDYGVCTTKDIKDNIDKYIELYDEDRIAYSCRSASEPRYRQIVGNLVCHKDRKLFMYLDEIETEENKHKAWKINQRGIEYLQSVDLIIPIDDSETECEIDLYQSVIEELEMDARDQNVLRVAENGAIKGRLNTSSKLAETVLSINAYKCQYGYLTGHRHTTFNRENGKKYAVAHHLIPMKATKDFFPKSLDRASNIVCLCPQCHSQIHYGSNEEKKKMLKVLYDAYIDSLEREEVYISFDQLFNKYYKQ